MRFIILSIGLLLAFAPSRAQRQLDLKECREMALEYSKQLAIAEKQKEKARQAQLGLPQPVEKGHLSVVFFSYKERECGIMVWGDKNAGKERRKQRTTGICKFGKHGAAGSLAAEDRRSH